MTAGTPDLEDLELLVLVARSGSIGAAARERGFAQPSVSRRMTLLERRIGVPLLSRSRRGTTLTPSGQVVVGWAEKLLASAYDFQRSVDTLRGSRRAAIRAAVSMTIAEHRAPAWLASLHERHPDIRVSLEVHNSSDVANLVEIGEADIGFIETPKVRPELRRRKVGTDRLVLAVAPDHEWARAGCTITAAELASSYLLVRESGSGTRETLDDALRSEGLELSAGMVMGSNAALRAAATSGIGPVVLSILALNSELASGRLVEVPVKGLSFRRPFSAVWLKDSNLDDGTLALLSVALAHMR